ncbi:MAG: DNA polymerase III subunit delta [Candidatus Wildermuthbacteria bacterium RIFCSPHIGHO2_12_FULL_40_12]|uniref:DNA polymerase III subunit delta n=1 Tax=Candidatus Wildermuthbacteria bacterium RIFCSPHIGHO2_12_FULL_40_12 TaxID=1802457 RepID=A0A1G2RBP6_9BACT|nr:MAG: DNA polymerase III subunit delta [Candidatus Wildermuthbacteria bacterium RIFCSPHIGHO2_12_FULL_40_12]
MLIFLYGQDNFRSRRKLNEIIEKYQKSQKSGFNLRRFDLAETDFQDVFSEFQQSSIFQEKKLLVLENVFSSPNLKEKLLENEKALLESKDAIVFYENDKLGKIAEKNAFFKFLHKEAKSQEFNLLIGQQLRSWARKELTKRKCEIEENALEKLIEFIGNDLWRFSNEIQKLSSFKSRIDMDAVLLLVKPKIETDIFKTIDCIAAKKTKTALKLIRQHLEDGENPLYLFSMMTFQFRNLLLVKSLEKEGTHHGNPYVMAGKLGMHPFVFSKTMRQVNFFTLEELKKIYRKIFQADLDIKTGKVQPDAALDLFIVTI